MASPLDSNISPAPKRGAPWLKSRDQLADDVLALFPALKKRLRESVPVEIREELERATWHQIGVLHQLAECPAGSTMSEVAKLQGCAMSSATALVDRLITHGLAERRPDPADRRVIRIAPTSAGEDFLRRVERARRRIALNALTPLDDEEIATVVRLLTKVAHGMQEAVTTDHLEVAHD